MFWSILFFQQQGGFMKFIKYCSTILLFTGIALTGHAAEEHAWKFSIGVNHRSFKEVSAKSTQLNGGAFLDGSVTGLDLNSDGTDDLWHYVVKDSQQQLGAALLSSVTYTQGRLTGESNKIDNGIGLVLKGSTALWQQEKLTLELDLSLATAFTHSGSSFGGTEVYTEYDIGESWNAGGAADPDQLEKFTGTIPLFIQVATGNGRVSLRSDLDLSIYTFAAGLSANYTISNFNLFAGVGPSLTVVDYDIESEFIGYWADGSGVFYSDKQSEDGIKLRAGGYVELGVDYDFTKDFSVGVAGRYDYIPVEVNNNLTSMDISGLSAQLFCSWKF